MLHCTANRQNDKSARVCLYISLPSLHDYDVKMPSYTFYGGREQATTNFFLFLNLDMVHKNSNLKELACI